MKKHTYYFVEDAWGGQHGSFIDEVELTVEEYKQAKKEGQLNGKRGFITKDYISALYATQY